MDLRNKFGDSTGKNGHVTMNDGIISLTPSGRTLRTWLSASQAPVSTAICITMSTPADVNQPVSPRRCHDSWDLVKIYLYIHIKSYKWDSDWNFWDIPGGHWTLCRNITIGKSLPALGRAQSQQGIETTLMNYTSTCAWVFCAWVLAS